MEFAFFMVSDFVRYDQVIFEMARVTPFLSKPATKDRMTTAEISLNWPRISRKNGVLH